MSKKEGCISIFRRSPWMVAVIWWGKDITYLVCLPTQRDRQAQAYRTVRQLIYDYNISICILEPTFRNNLDLSEHKRLRYVEQTFLEVPKVLLDQERATRAVIAQKIVQQFPKLWRFSRKKQSLEDIYAFDERHLIILCGVALGYTAIITTTNY